MRRRVTTAIAVTQQSAAPVARSVISSSCAEAAARRGATSATATAPGANAANERTNDESAIVAALKISSGRKAASATRRVLATEKFHGERGGRSAITPAVSGKSATARSISIR